MAAGEAKLGECLTIVPQCPLLLGAGLQGSSETLIGGGKMQSETWGAEAGMLVFPDFPASSHSWKTRQRKCRGIYGPSKKSEWGASKLDSQASLSQEELGVESGAHRLRTSLGLGVGVETPGLAHHAQLRR